MKISVIVPIYNIEDCLERCVHSITNQTYSDLEIILVDDGSTDGTPAMVDRLAAQDSRIRAFHKANGGSSSARNMGIRNATGDYLGFVDSDDYIEPDMYEKLVTAAKQYGAKVVQICRDEVAEDLSELPSVVTPPDQITEMSPEDFLKELLLHKGDCSFCTKLIARELFEVGLFPEGELNEDFRLFTQMLGADVKDNGATDSHKLIDKVIILPDVGYHVFYRMGSNTRTNARNVFPRVFTDIVVNADRIEKIVRDSYPELEAYARRFALVQRLDYLLHIPVSMMNSDNEFYIQVKKYLWEHRNDIKNNKFLSDDQRSKLSLLSRAPKMVRIIHLLTMKLRGM